MWAADPIIGWGMELKCSLYWCYLSEALPYNAVTIAVHVCVKQKLHTFCYHASVKDGLSSVDGVLRHEVAVALGILPQVVVNGNGVHRVGGVSSEIQQFLELMFDEL